MLADIKTPLTNDDLLPLLDADGFYRFGGSLDDYWQLLSEATYQADYYDHQIITTMSYESDNHSHIAARFTAILFQIFDGSNDFRVYNSNRPVYIPDCTSTGTGVFNADGMVVALPRVPHTYKPGLSAETNPTLLIEILSPSTRSYDFGTKLPCYRQIPSLQQILFVEQASPEVIVFDRQAPNRWADITLQHLDDTFTIAGQTVSLRTIYQGVLD
jgi:Uma2 family endonuclease